MALYYVVIYSFNLEVCTDLGFAGIGNPAGICIRIVQESSGVGLKVMGIPWEWDRGRASPAELTVDYVKLPQWDTFLPHVFYYY